MRHMANFDESSTNQVKNLSRSAAFGPGGEPGQASRTMINPNLPEQAAEILRGVDMRQAIPA